MKTIDFIRILSLMLATLIQGIFLATAITLAMDNSHYISVSIFLGLVTLGCGISCIYELTHINFRG